jgi:hypothetical protein
MTYLYAVHDLHMLLFLEKGLVNLSKRPHSIVQWDSSHFVKSARWRY